MTDLHNTPGEPGPRPSGDLRGLDGLHDDEIPPLLPPGQMPPLHTPSDVHRQWRAMMGPLGFGFRRLWVQPIGADRRSDALITIDDPPVLPDRDGVRNLVAMLAPQADSLAFLLSRPGRGRLRADDVAWARALLDECEGQGVRCEPVHVACDAWLVPVTPDDLAA